MPIDKRTVISIDNCVDLIAFAKRVTSSKLIKECWLLLTASGWVGSNLETEKAVVLVSTIFKSLWTGVGLARVWEVAKLADYTAQRRGRQRGHATHTHS